MKTIVNVRKDGRIPLPRALRDRFKLKKGDVVAVDLSPDGTVLTWFFNRNHS